MKKTYGCFEKGHEIHGKKKKNCFLEQNWNWCTKHKFFWWDPRILFYKHENSFVKVCIKQALMNLKGSRLPLLCCLELPMEQREEKAHDHEYIQSLALLSQLG